MVALATSPAYSLALVEESCAFIARHLHQPLTWLWEQPITELFRLHDLTIKLLESEGKVRREAK